MIRTNPYDSRHKAQDEGFPVTVATPHLVPAECWNFLGYSVQFGPVHKPNPSLHLREWFNHNPPPGTVYDIFPRLDYQAWSGDARFRAEVDKRLDKLFPAGLQKVSLTDFHGPPADGVRLGKLDKPPMSFGLREGDVIVAIYGVRTHTPNQYKYVRDGNTDPELDLIVWQTNAYHELKISPPRRRFGAQLYGYQGGR